MTIGRLGIHKSDHLEFHLEHGSCGCRILSTPIAVFTLFDKECKCENCEQHGCECVCGNCGEIFSECNCKDAA